MMAKMGAFLVVFYGFAAQAAQTEPIRTSMTAESPMSDYTAAVFIQVMIIGVLVSVLLIGGFLVLNLGLLSKRQEDRIGGRTPSDVGILKSSTWPPGEDDRPTLPAEEDEDQGQAA